MKEQLHTHLIIILLICLSTTALNLFAQNQGKRSRNLSDTDRIEKTVNRMSEKLSLSDDQEKEILGLYTTHFELVKEIRNSENEDREEKREQMKLLNNQLDDNIKALLNEEQIEKYENFNQNRKQRYGRRNRSQE